MDSRDRASGLAAGAMLLLPLTALARGRVPPLPAGCPWSDWAPPTLRWCEDNLCSWITTPANTWSNVVYLLAGAVMLRQATASGQPALRRFGHASIILGFCSFAYHASYTLFFQFFDYLGMFLFILLFLCANMRRAGITDERSQEIWYRGGVVACCGVLGVVYAVGLPVQAVIAALVLVVLGQEVSLRGRCEGLLYADLVQAYGLLLVATAFTLVDVTGFWCDPSNHWLQGHALWHVFSALGLYKGFQFYRQSALVGTVQGAATTPPPGRPLDLEAP